MHLKTEYKSLFEKQAGLCVTFGLFPFSWNWIRVRIPKTDPDPGEQNQSGSSKLIFSHFILGSVWYGTSAVQVRDIVSYCS
jgi:hypothetical protein